MHFWLTLLVISCFLVFYNYAGYAVIVFLANRLKGRRPMTGPEPDFLPTVSFIVAAYNEEYCIAQKIANSLELDYPPEKIEFLFITDGSNDRTVEIIHTFPRIRSLHRPGRNGKSAALNRAVEEAAYEILIFSDANTLLNKEAVRNITRHYRDEKVGGVAGEKKVLSTAAGDNQVGEGEGLYWKYESFLKKADAEFYSVVGAAGELFSFRTLLYEPISHNVILDDFVSSLKITQHGYRIEYEPDAYAVELPSFSLKDEKKRKVRIAAGGFQSIGMLTPLLAFWRYPRLSFLYISHRVLRWAVSPFCLILAFISNTVLFVLFLGSSGSAGSSSGSSGSSSWSSAGGLITLLFWAQVIFYGMALAATLAPGLQKRSKLIKLAYYFVFMNACAVLGFFRFLRGGQSATWEKAKRAQAA